MKYQCSFFNSPILGRIPSGFMGLFTDCVLGLEFAGRRADTGERVMGFAESRAFATDINATEDWLTTIPNHWSMDDAVTILSTYSTLWYGLIERGRMKKGLFNCESERYNNL
jgi:NADPH:quinone reductase-like Zn-dependent oxidoreductase